MPGCVCGDAEASNGTKTQKSSTMASQSMLVEDKQTLGKRQFLPARQGEVAHDEGGQTGETKYHTLTPYCARITTIYYHEMAWRM